MQHDLELFRNLEQKLFDQAVRGSPEAVNMLLADEFVEFGRSGKVYYKDEIVRDLAAEHGDVNPPMRTACDFELKALADDVVLLTYRSIRTFPALGQEQHSLRSSIWKFIGGRWQMVFHQGTPTQQRLPPRS